MHRSNWYDLSLLGIDNRRPETSRLHNETNVQYVLLSYCAMITDKNQEGRFQTKDKLRKNSCYSIFKILSRRRTFCHALIFKFKILLDIFKTFSNLSMRTIDITTTM